MVAADSSPSQQGAAPAPALRLEQRPGEQEKATGENGRAPLAAVVEKCNTGGGARKPKNREITSRYKSAPTAAAPAQPSSAARARHPSPNLGRVLGAEPSPAPKRAVSAERRRAWPPPEQKAAPASPAEAPWPVPKTRIAARGPELLWPSSHGQRNSDGGGLPSGNADARRSPAPERTPSALRPASNGHRPLPTPHHQRRESPMRRQSGDGGGLHHGEHALRSRPPELQRWPGSSNGKVLGPAALTRSVDLSADRGRPAPVHRSISLGAQGRPVTSSGYGVTSSSSSAARPRPTASSLLASARSFTRSVNEGPSAPASSSRSSTPERRSRARAPPPPPPPAERPRSGSAVRKSVQEAAVLAGSDAGDNASDSESVSSGGSGAGSRASSARGTIVPARVWQAPEAAARSRRMSEGTRLRASMSEQDLSAATRAARKAIALGTPPGAGGSSSSSAWSLSSARGIMPVSSPQPPSSPARGRGGSSPLRGLPSPTRTRSAPPQPPLLNGALAGRTPTISALNFGTDLRSRGKKAMSQHEEALLLRILHNRYLQWRFINARADAALVSQRVSAEKSMYSVWMRTSQLRSSVATQRIRLQQAKHFHKLKSVLSKQAPQLQCWSALKHDHSTALLGVVEALEASILRVPVTGGARADVQAVKEALGSAVDVMNAVELSVKNLLPKAQAMDGLVAQLADTASQERAILAECGDLLSTAASLEIEERSLTTHLVQIQHERNRQAASPSPASHEKSTVDATPEGLCPA